MKKIFNQTRVLIYEEAKLILILIGNSASIKIENLGLN